MPNVNMMAPFNPYSVDAAAIERQRQLAELMQQQSMQPIQSPTAQGPLGNVTTPISWTQGLAKMLQAYQGAKGQTTANEMEKALGQRYTSDLSGTLQRAMQAGSGTPASTEILPMDEQANGGLGAANQPINTPAQAPDMQRMASILMEHPATQPAGQQQMMMNMQRQMLISALGGGGGGAQPQQAAQASGSGMPTQPKSQPQATPSVGGPAGGVPMAAWLQGDPTGKTYMEQLAKDHAESIKPVVNRGYGIGTMVNGKYTPDPASLSQALAVEKGKAGISQPYESPVTLKTTTGREIQLSRPEWAAYQQNGILPPRIIGTQVQGTSVPASDLDAMNKVASADKLGIPMSAQGAPPDLGTPGVSQSQQDQIQQQAQAEGAKKVMAGQGDTFNAHYDSAVKGVQTLPMILAARQALDSGAVTGVGAPFFLNMHRVLSAAGFQQSQDAVQNTQTFAATTARQVLQIIKNLGSGSGISDADREYASKIIGGDISLDAPSIKRLLQISDIAIRNDAQWVNTQVPKWQKRGADLEPINIDQFAGSMTNGRPNAPQTQTKGALTPQEQTELNQLRARFGSGR